MNEERFTGKAELYDKYRPSYPKELIDWLYDNPNFSKYKSALEQLFQKYQKDGSIAVKGSSVCYLGKF